MQKFKLLYNNFIEDESGQDLIEYALVAALIGLAAVAALRPIGLAIVAIFNAIATDLQSALT